MSDVELQQLLDDAARRNGVPGSAFALLKDGDLSVFTTGVLSVETEEVVRADSMFQIGSITKVLTATLVMKLVDDGRIDLDEPVRRYLPTFRSGDLNATKTVTIRQLLCHSSGLDGDFFTDTGGGPERLARYIDRCALLPQLFEPGSDFSYSNAGFNLAGRVVEVVSGLDYDTALRRYLFDPLALKHSASDIKDLPGRSLASGHSPDPKHPGQYSRLSTLYTLPVSAGPAGSTTMMSVGDLVTFAKMHLASGKNASGESLLSESSVAAMQEVQVRVPVPARGLDAWGLGWFFQDVDGAGLIGHDGGTVGQCSFLRIDRRTGTVAVLFANCSPANDFYLDVFGEVFDPLVGCKTPRAPEVSSAPPDDIAKYAGTYCNVVGETKIKLGDSGLTRSESWRFDDTVIHYPEVAMEYVGDDSFIWRAPGQTSPTLGSFRKFSDDGRPQSLFSGLRWYHRVD